ncbi:MAG: SDR family oxidoreductase [Nitrosomonadales bacterium]|nr:SDR family oxidoreductase [Nitrosomonadales bacterium]
MSNAAIPGNGTALVTGASGFVGRCLCAEMLRRGWQVRAAVRSSAPGPDGAQAVTVGDIDGDTDWTDALRGVEVVFHLAARVHVMKDTSADPLAEFLRVNLEGTANLARQAARAGVQRLVYASSIKVNGEKTSASQPFTELDEADPQDPYGISKWQAEQALQRIAQETGLEVVIVRPPLVYGPGVKGNFISLLAAIDKGIPLPLAGARNARSLVYVGNLADALIACATHAAAAGQTYLVSDGQDVSTAMLAEKIADALGRNSRAFYFPPLLLRGIAALLGRSAQVDRLFGSLRVSDAKIRRELNWIAPCTLDRGLRATADWYRKSRGVDSEAVRVV